ncbi:MAG: class I SAM-dependent methyltransferase [Deltaproteobacteria bacterium]|nr:class I SAM-dependent methyltransferase [Deltaproteobacteria bacterium]
MTDEASQQFLERAIPQYLVHAPLALCLRELNRLLALRWIEGRHGRLEGPVLDVGCGDGYWWKFLDRVDRQVFGVDISARELEQARRVLDGVERADVSCCVPFAGRSFRGVIGNCSLEHVPDIDSALRNLRRAVGAGARLVTFVPTATWAIQGRTQSFLMRHLPRLGMAFAGALNGFFQHWHVYHHRVWTSLLQASGWEVEAIYGLGNRRSEFLFRAFLPLGFVAFLVKTVTGHYPNRLLRYLPAALLVPSVTLVRRALASPIVDADEPAAYELVLVARARVEP